MSDRLLQAFLVADDNLARGLHPPTILMGFALIADPRMPPGCVAISSAGGIQVRDLLEEQS